MAMSGFYNEFWTLVLTCFCVIFLSSTVVAVTCNGPRTKGQLREHLWGTNSNYDTVSRPNVAVLEAIPDAEMIPSSAAPDVVKIQLHILSIKSLQIITGEFTLMLWLRQGWNDPRLAYSTVSNGGGCFPDNTRQGFPDVDLGRIWKPDLVVNNMIEETKIASSFWIYPNGDVEYSQSLLLTLSCQMDVSNYPRDTQRCSVALGTWLEDASEVVLDFWDGSEGPVTLSREEEFGSTIADTNDPNEWNLLDVETFQRNNAGAIFQRSQQLFREPLGSTQQQQQQQQQRPQESELLFTFTLERNAEVYRDFIVTPILLIVVLSWASFFIERKAAPARVTMSTVCFLTNINYLSGAYQSTPPFTNQVWILRFLNQSMFFTFYAVIEYVICNYLFRVEARLKEGRQKAVEYKLKSMDEHHKSHMKRALSEKLGGGIIISDEQIVSGEFDAKFITKSDFEASGYSYRIDRLVLGRNGEMLFRDEHVDIFSRYAYPIVYIICFSFLWASA